MKRLLVRDIRPPGRFLTLAEILEVVAPLTSTTHWQVEEFDDELGETWFQFADEAWSDHRFAEDGLRLPAPQFVEMARTMPQAIWASFSGYRPAGAESPWIALHAIDSSYWRIDTDSERIRRVVKTGFDDVREPKP